MVYGSAFLKFVVVSILFSSNRFLCETCATKQGIVYVFHTSASCAFLFQSLKSRGIRFPGRDNESLAPIFTPPRSVSAPDPASDPDASLLHQLQHDAPVLSFTEEQTKEAFDVARNCIELLSTVLSSSPQQDVLEVFLSCFLCCRVHIY